MDFVPAFERQILEETDRYIIVRRETGIIAKEFKGELSYHMPQWLDFPLKTRHDWEDRNQTAIEPPLSNPIPGILGRKSAYVASAGLPTDPADGINLWLAA